MNRVVLSLALLWLSIAAQSRAADTEGNWAVYGGNEGNQKYSKLHQIDLANVSKLKLAWSFHTGDAHQPRSSSSTWFEATPLYIDGTLYFPTPLGRVIALEPTTGKQLWAFDAKVNRDGGYGDFAARGVSMWKGSNGQQRIFVATVDARLIALDAASGKLCSDFGDNGEINLRNGLRIPPVDFASYEVTSPPAVVGNVLVVGSAVADNGSVGQPSGEVRAFDVLSGKRLWSWDPIPQNPKAVGADTWKNGSAARTGAANAWSVIASDSERGLVFIPTGSASPDYFGGERKGANLFANSVVALRAQTGERVWHFQTVHHDLWDYDIASPPLLFDAQRNGHAIPAIAIGSKTGNLFILNRETGEPLFGIEERPVPQSDVPGEEISPTQPYPLLPKPLSPQGKVTPNDAWGIDENERAWCKAEMEHLRSEGIFTPPSIRGSLFLPGNIGGMAWGGGAFDPVSRSLLIPVNNLAAEVRLIPRDKFDEDRKQGRELGGNWEYARQSGTPFGMARRLLLSPKRFPCNAPPWSMLKAINVDNGELRWQVPLGELPSAAGAAEAGKWGSISLGGPLSTLR